MEALNQPSNDFERMKNNVLHSDSLLALSTSATLAQCSICRQTWGKITQIYPDLDPNTYSDYKIECCWTAVNGMHKETKMWMVMYNPSVQKWPVHNYQHILRLGLWPKAHFGLHFDKDINREKIVNTRGAWDECANNDTNDHADTRSLVLSWMARCIQNDHGQHDICNRKDENYIPTRLLDVSHALEMGRVRLICPNEMPQMFASKLQYATLSHCWGARGAKENAVLLTSNIESRQSDGLAWDMLPKTFQDAFKVASWLRIDWLWIDSLCIIQDSQSDWQKEVSMMDRVYMNAEVNISADSGENSRAGCFVKRKDIDTTPLEFANPHIERAWIMTTEETFGWMNSAPSLSRAWIHRERQLSRRILHFTKKEVVWECCGRGKACFASETMPGGAPFEKVFNGETKFQIQCADLDVDFTKGEKRSQQERLDKLYKLWNSTCQDLSKKSITYASDLPIILSSLAREFHRMMPNDEYIAGHWRSTLIEALTWWVPDNEVGNNGDIAPTWSWLSVAGPVKLYEPGHQQHKRNVAEILAMDKKLDSSSSDPYGQLTGGVALHVRGFVRRLHFHFTGHQNNGIILSVVEKDTNGRDRLRTIGPDWNKDEGQVFRVSMDCPLSLPYQEFECYALFTTLDEWAQFRWDCRRELACLLLEKVAVDVDRGSEETGRYYKRVGTLHTTDTYSFKMRYQVAPDAEVPEAGSLRDIYEENPTRYTGIPPPDKWYDSRKGAAATKLDAERTQEEFDPENENGGVSECPKSEATLDATGSSLMSRSDSEGSSSDSDSAVDIWGLLVQYISRNRWMIIRDFKEEAKEAEKAASLDGEENELDEGEQHVAENDSEDSESQPNTHNHSHGGAWIRDQNTQSEAKNAHIEAQNETPGLEESNNTSSAPEHVESYSSSCSDAEDINENVESNEPGECESHGESDGHREDSDEERKKRRQEYLHLGAVIFQLHKHPSSGLTPIHDADDLEEAWNQLQEALDLQSETVAYGTDQPHDPEAALYQFDDVLHMWQKLYNVVPWLRRLEVCDITLI
jgi:hypothetical protein